MSTCADIVELVAPVHTCTGTAFTVDLPVGGPRTFDCDIDWTSEPDIVHTLDPHYSGPLDEFCPHQCDETRSPGQYSCSGDCEVELAGTTCTGAPFMCRPPLDTSAGYNYTRCFDAVDAASCASMGNDDSSATELLGCVGISTVRKQIPVLSSAV